MEKVLPLTLSLNGHGEISRGEVINKIMEREKENPTALEHGVALPHARLDGLQQVICKLIVLNKGVMLTANPCQIIFLFFTPSDQTELHLQILSQAAKLLKDEGIVSKLVNAASGDEIKNILVSGGKDGRHGFMNLEKSHVFQELETGKEGLSQEKAKKRLEIYGPNILKKVKQTPAYVKLLKNFVSLFAILLWVGGGMCFIPGVDMPQLGWAIFAVILVNALFSFWQEFKAEKAIDALLRLLPQKAKVLRDGKKLEILASELVPGDIIFFEEGDAIPVDARLIESSEMRVNNAALTGESRPIYKMSEPLKGEDFFLWTEFA